MKLKFLIFAMAVAAMGPGRDAPVPDAAATRDAVPQRNPARLPPVADSTPAPVPEAEATEADAMSQTPDGAPILGAEEASPQEYLWSGRPVVVFADTPGDPAFMRQLEALRRESAALAMRDVVVITDTDPAANSVWRQQLRPSGFSLVLIDKDGQVKIRRPSPWDVREIGRAIDRLPLRRQEVGRGGVIN
ncbi:DUF4174 domain-containing protein [Paracoccus aestuarii]|uniref:DUF4174 domain-containing protein n=1 Tax=Paracoccus aestuarii TaxID=453842 RepID=A0A419A1E2_9RHOB|nr:DUF4174 domain-containing protein [Paracoccus aestuarii]RJL06746.1 DUF4174 domain-containing protein [Paracoccus aestuarii]WCQ98001.1 DUF4174 domain-containing protein [Paracoccus aestuarii]